MTESGDDRESTLQRRVKERLALLKRSARDVSLSAGLSADAIRTILSGRSRSPRGESLAALARELQCEVSYLIGTSDRPWSEDSLRRDEYGVLSGIGRLELQFNLGLDWLESVDYVEQFGTKVALTDVYTLPDLYTGYQALELVTDDHFNLIVPKGSFVHTLHSLGHGIALEDRDLVVVQRQRLGEGDESRTQRSLRRVRKLPDSSIWLETASTNPDLQDIILYAPEKPGAGSWMDRSIPEMVDIWAIVLRHITRVSGPDLVRMIVDVPGEEKITDFVDE